MNTFRKIRSKITKVGFIKFIILIINTPFNNKQRAEYKKMLSLDSNKEKFSLIYSKKFWHSNESGSGKGSEIIYTQNVRSWLIGAIPSYGVNRFVDAACGDFIDGFTPREMILVAKENVPNFMQDKIING